MCENPGWVQYDYFKQEYVYMGKLDKSDMYVLNILPTLEYLPLDDDIDWVREYKDTKQISLLPVDYSIQNSKIYLVPCRKCKQCRKSKQSEIANKVRNQFNQSSYMYLWTITFSNETIDTFTTKEEFNQLDHHLKSGVSTLSKNRISNIIRNLKKKLLRHYSSIDFHYLLSGEYGSKTDRAHYHIILMLDKPIPYLERERVKGHHYKSQILESQQYDLYDLELINSENENVSYYITKYLTKQQETYLNNYNRYQENLIKWYRNRNIDVSDFRIPKNNRVVYQSILKPTEHELKQNQKYIEKYTSPITKQDTFIKMSRQLGIKHLIEQNDYKRILEQNQLNAYYTSKAKNYIREQLYWDLYDLDTDEDIIQQMINEKASQIWEQEYYKPYLEQYKILKQHKHINLEIIKPDSNKLLKEQILWYNKDKF